MGSGRDIKLYSMTKVSPQSCRGVWEKLELCEKSVQDHNVVVLLTGDCIGRNANRKKS